MCRTPVPGHTSILTVLFNSASKQSGWFHFVGQFNTQSYCVAEEFIVFGPKGDT